mmetsp:Transcript_8980/g.18716  ORF Transcript_8980/g.18716 Transcript_8980/m.18716 type:complete len:110 (-) Transcript_8980:207-536(-)
MKLPTGEAWAEARGCALAAEAQVGRLAASDDQEAALPFARACHPKVAIAGYVEAVVHALLWRLAAVSSAGHLNAEASPSAASPPATQRDPFALPSVAGAARPPTPLSRS